jgi:hypothetical protein
VLIRARSRAASVFGLIKIDTVVKANGTFSATAGLVRIPAGFWRLSAGIATTLDSTTDFTFCQWYLDPAGANTVISPGQYGVAQSTALNNATAGGLAGNAFALLHITAEAVVGLRLATADVTTVTVDAAYTKALIEEVSPWPLT